LSEDKDSWYTIEDCVAINYETILFKVKMQADGSTRYFRNDLYHMERIGKTNMVWEINSNNPLTDIGSIKRMQAY